MGLVISRRESESFSMRDDETDELIVVTILGIKGRQVRIHIDASQHFKILRSELEGSLAPSAQRREGSP